MQIGMIGLGRMGANMARRLLKGNHHCVVFNRSRKPVEDLAEEGAVAASSLEDLVKKLTKPRAIWMMIPSAFVKQLIADLLPHLEPEDILIDGGNSYYVDAKELAAKKIHYVDCGTSGGVMGMERGYFLMIGGTKQAVQRLEPIYKTLAPGVGDIPRTPGREKCNGTAEQGHANVSAMPVPVLSTAFYARFSSRGQAEFADKLLSAMRFELGGHSEKSDGK